MSLWLQVPCQHVTLRCRDLILTKGVDLEKAYLPYTAFHAHDSKVNKKKFCRTQLLTMENMQLCNNSCKRRQRIHVTFVASCRIIRAGRTTKPTQWHYQCQSLASSPDVEKAFMFCGSSLWYDNNVNSYRITIQKQLPPAASQPLQLKIASCFGTLLLASLTDVMMP